MDHALIVLLGMLGLRVGEACRARIEELSMQFGHRVLLVHGKGGKDALMPLPPAVARSIDLAIEGRSSGPILLTRVGTPMNRHAAARTIDRTARNARIGQHVHPHVLRHAFVTTLLDAGVPLRDVHIAARHADPRTTTRYDRARANLDRHAVYLLAAFMAGAA
jgi:site-specific recombinase XerD